jgi:tetratricopeptide (TPR) repeat protein
MSAEKVELIRTSFSHRGLALVGTTLVLFEVIFVVLLATPFWFDLNLVPLGIPAVVAIAFVADILLKLLESKAVSRRLKFVLNGRPLLVYRQWIRFDEHGFTFGVKRLRWDIVDEAALNFFGTLLIKSRNLCGPAEVVNEVDQNPADVIVKLPFAAIDFASQNLFVNKVRSKKPDVLFNKRLTKQIEQKLIKGMQYVQGASVVILALALLDLGYATFAYLETLKQYYLCRVDAASAQIDSARAHFEKAEELRLNPLPISYITPRLTSFGGVSETYQQARWEALWALGRREEALAVAKSVADQSPKGFRSHLKVARLYSELGNDQAAQAQIEEATKKREDALLPRFYLFSYFMGKHESDQARQKFNEYSAKLDDEVFGKEPAWPPGDIRYVDSVWYEDDLKFVLNRLLGVAKK